jgi:pyruvate dehydrogenase E2 component (dihydrolipoamide acetyltransferase)
MTHEIRMPVLSQSMIQGRVVEWLANEGEKIDKGSLLVVVESDKATHELEAPQTGILHKILVDAGSEVDVDTPLAIIADEAEVTFSTVESLSSNTAEVNHQANEVPSIRIGERRPITPAAKRLSKELGINLDGINGTGEDGLIIEKDILSYKETHQTGISGEVDDIQVIPLTGQRGRIAERMALSRRTAADVTTVMDVDMSQVVAHRSRTRYSFTAYVAWAASRSLLEFPTLNAWIMDDRILLKSGAHLGVAVAMENALVVPVLRNADRKSVSEIDMEIDGLSTKARAGQLTPDDMKGSTFTVTNSGVFGSLFFTPIINLPEVAVLGMGKVDDVPVVRNGQVVASKVMYLCLSYDHRAVDGSTAVQFLKTIKDRLENIS